MTNVSLCYRPVVDDPRVGDARSHPRGSRLVPASWGERSLFDGGRASLLDEVERRKGAAAGRRAGAVGGGKEGKPNGGVGGVVEQNGAVGDKGNKARGAIGGAPPPPGRKGNDPAKGGAGAAASPSNQSPRPDQPLSKAAGRALLERSENIDGEPVVDTSPVADPVDVGFSLYGTGQEHVARGVTPLTADALKSLEDRSPPARVVQRAQNDPLEEDEEDQPHPTPEADRDGVPPLHKNQQRRKNLVESLIEYLYFAGAEGEYWIHEKLLLDLAQIQKEVRAKKTKGLPGGKKADAKSIVSSWPRWFTVLETGEQYGAFVGLSEECRQLMLCFEEEERFAQDYPTDEHGNRPELTEKELVLRKP